MTTILAAALAAVRPAASMAVLAAGADAAMTLVVAPGLSRNALAVVDNSVHGMLACAIWALAAQLAFPSYSAGSGDGGMGAGATADAGDAQSAAALTVHATTGLALVGAAALDAASSSATGWFPTWWRGQWRWLASLSPSDGPVVARMAVAALTSLHPASAGAAALCGLVACAMDADHFIAAGSLTMAGAMHLASRPFGHSVTFLAAAVAATWALVRRPVYAWLLLAAAWGSHQARDATRRGLWCPPVGSTPPVPYALYLTAMAAAPYAVAAVLRAQIAGADAGAVGTEGGALLAGPGAGGPCPYDAAAGLP
jgi:hypothetical protein